MKRLWILLLIIVLVLSGCKGKDESTKEVVVNEDSGDDVKVDVDKNKDSTEISTEDGQKIEVANDMDKGIDLPEDYPNDLLPVYSEEFIAVAMKNPDESYSIIGMTNDSLDKVKEFYVDVLKDGKSLVTQQEEDSYFTMGEFEEASYSVMIGDADEESYKTMFTLTILPGQTMGMDADEEADADSDEKEDADEDQEEDSDDEEKVEAPIIVPEDLMVPDSYPEKALPFYPTGKTEVAMGQEGMMAIKTEDKTDDVAEYYKELLGEADDFSEMNMPPTIMLSGTLDETVFTIMIMENSEGSGEDERFKSLIQIIYE